jgi:nitroreductase
VADHDGHSLLVSCGGAIELTEIALRAHGWAAKATLLPEPADPNLFARFRLDRFSDPDRLAEAHLAAALTRRSERRPFGPTSVTAEVIERLGQAAASRRVSAHFTVRPDESLELAVAISRADRSERDDPAYAAEMAQWVRYDGRAVDGVPMSAVPHVPDEQPRHTDIPLRNFEAGMPGTQLITSGIDEKPLIAVILTQDDNALERLRAGQAMMRLMIQAEVEGIASCPLSQAVDMLSFRTELRSVMSWVGHPQIMLRLGPRPAGPPAPLTLRRPVGEVLAIGAPHGWPTGCSAPSAPLDTPLHFTNQPYPLTRD